MALRAADGYDGLARSYKPDEPETEKAERANELTADMTRRMRVRRRLQLRCPTRANPRNRLTRVKCCADVTPVM